jgi:hypothetical protein
MARCSSPMRSFQIKTEPVAGWRQSQSHRGRHFAGRVRRACSSSSLTEYAVKPWVPHGNQTSPNGVGVTAVEVHTIA